MCFPSAEAAVNAIFWPSGEMTAASCSVSLNDNSSGGLNESRTACASFEERLENENAPNASKAAANATAVMIQGTRARHVDFFASVTATVAATVKSRPEELVGADSASSAKLRSAVD